MRVLRGNALYDWPQNYRYFFFLCALAMKCRLRIHALGRKRTCTHDTHSQGAQLWLRALWQLLLTCPSLSPGDGDASLFCTAVRIASTLHSRQLNVSMPQSNMTPKHCAIMLLPPDVVASRPCTWLAYIYAYFLTHNGLAFSAETLAPNSYKSC